MSSFPFAHEGPSPDALGDAAQLPARVVAREHPQKWATLGLPDSLAVLNIPVETVWAAVQLALSGANQHTLASTLGLSEHDARDVIIATTEQLVADPGRWRLGRTASVTVARRGGAELIDLAVPAWWSHPAA